MKMEELSMETEQIDVIIEAPNPEAETASLEAEEITTNGDEICYQYPALFTSKSLLELSSSSWSRSVRADDKVQPFLRGCKWSPDGTCCLSVVNNDGVHVNELPRELYTGGVKSDRLIDVLDSVIHVKEAGLIYDFCWYPKMNSSLPETCCWLTTRQNGPIQMWDAFDGSLRCSYRGFDCVDEMENALSIAFKTDGSKIFAGYKKALRTFVVERPGRDYTQHRISYPASCLATHSNVLAVGSWNTAITLYNITEMGSYKSIGKMYGHRGGVTHMKFTPDGLKLVTGARKDHRLLVWDMRHYQRPLNILSRPTNTNQRIYFDISPCGKYLVSGATDGVVNVWDVDQVDWQTCLDSENMEGDNVTYKFPLHKDCCNSISIHPFRPILATGSGQLHYKDPTDSLDNCSPEIPQSNDELYLNGNSVKEIQTNETSLESDGTKEERSKYNSINEGSRTIKEIDMKYSSYAENSLVFWWTGEVPDLT